MSHLDSAVDQIFDFHAGTVPLLVSMPHAGTGIPDPIAASMTPEALLRADTDWHLPQLYEFLQGMGVSTIAARYSRYVIDLNRPDTDTNLYPGQDTTGLCPLDTFFKAPLYQAGKAPDQAEIARRLQHYWQPYHYQLRTELDRLLQLYPVVALWDAHSIASHVPRFFAGKLPDLNLGTADGKSCAAGMLDAVTGVVARQQQFTLAVNGRFKGGHITRHYGQQTTLAAISAAQAAQTTHPAASPAGQSAAAKPAGAGVAAGVHSIQLEMCQSAYMNESAPFAYRPDLAQQVQPLVQSMVQAVLDWIQGANQATSKLNHPAASQSAMQVMAQSGGKS